MAALIPAREGVPASLAGSVGHDLAALIVLLALELLVLRRGQRRLFWATVRASRSRLIAYALAFPGTVLHEASHYLACMALGVPVGRQLAGGSRVRLFWPRSTPDGDVILGGVPHARTDPIRQALIATAPLLLMPPLLAALTSLLLGPDALGTLPDVLGRVPLWQAAVWAYLSLSCGQAAFPSPGDHIGVLGGAVVVAATAGLAIALLALGSSATLSDLLAAVVGLLALPAIAAALMLLAFGLSTRLGRA